MTTALTLIAIVLLGAAVAARTWKTRHRRGRYRGGHGNTGGLDSGWSGNGGGCGSDGGGGSN
jgi:hypothetical protein